MSFEEYLSELELSEQEYVAAVRASIKTTTVFLKRSPAEIRVNAYNPDVLLAWRANMDIQFITNVYACARYVASYVTKAQRGISELLRKACGDVCKGNESIRQQMKHIGGKFINSVELSAQEAAYLVLGLPFRKSSRAVKFVNTNLPQDSVFLLKSDNILSTMDDDDEDIAQKSIIDRYEDRPTSMEDVTLAEYAASYNFKTKSYRSRQKKNVGSDGYLQKEIEDNEEDKILEEEDINEKKEISARSKQADTMELTKRKVIYFELLKWNCRNILINNLRISERQY